MSARADHIATEASSLLEQGRSQQALALVQRGLAAEPSNLNLVVRMVDVLMRTGPEETMFRFADRCIAMAPDNAIAVHTAAFARAQFGRHQGAIDASEAFLKKHPRHPDAGLLLEVYFYSCSKLNRYDDLLDMAERHPEICRQSPDAANQVCSAMLACGRAQEAFAGLLKLAEAEPNSPLRASAVCFASNYCCDKEPPEIFGYHQSYGQIVRSMKLASPPAPPCGQVLPLAERKIKVGLLSADLWDHSVAFFVEPLLAGLDRQRFEITVFQLGISDHATRRLFEAVGGSAERWVNLNGLDMEDLATAIRARGLDMLIELGGHTGGSALLAMARNPAPIVGTWCGYPHTTGLDDVHVRFVDSLTDPTGSEGQAVERLIRLDPCFLCYRPSVELLATPLAPPPCLANGFVTFGSFNTITKFNPATATLWAAAMAAVPDSRLLLKAPVFTSQRIAERIRAELAGCGIAPERVETVAFLPNRQDAMALYNKVDIALDPYPYHGTTTTCEALGMGVPVVSLIGDRHASRVGLSLLLAVGLGELATGSRREFVAAAATLAGDRQRLAATRASLRQRLMASPLCDERAFCDRFGDALLALVREAAERNTG